MDNFKKEIIEFKNLVESKKEPSFQAQTFRKYFPYLIKKFPDKEILFRESLLINKSLYESDYVDSIIEDIVADIRYIAKYLLNQDKTEQLNTICLLPEKLNNSLSPKRSIKSYFQLLEILSKNIHYDYLDKKSKIDIDDSDSYIFPLKRILYFLKRIESIVIDNILLLQEENQHLVFSNLDNKKELFRHTQLKKYFDKKLEIKRRILKLEFQVEKIIDDYTVKDFEMLVTSMFALTESKPTSFWHNFTHLLDVPIPKNKQNNFVKHLNIVIENLSFHDSKFSFDFMEQNLDIRKAGNVYIDLYRGSVKYKNKNWVVITQKDSISKWDSAIKLLKILYDSANTLVGYDTLENHFGFTRTEMKYMITAIRKALRKSGMTKKGTKKFITVRSNGGYILSTG